MGLLAISATLYSVVTILLSLMQVRKMLVRHEACDVSQTWLGANFGGYIIWLAYGVVIGSVPLMVSDGLGVICGGLTLGTALVMGNVCVPAVKH